MSVNVSGGGGGIANPVLPVCVYILESVHSKIHKNETIPIIVHVHLYGSALKPTMHLLGRTLLLPPLLTPTPPFVCDLF